MKKRADGRLVKKIIIDGKEKYFYGKSQKELNEKILNFKERQIKGLKFSEVATLWDAQHNKEVTYATKKRYKPLYNRAVAEFGEMYINQITSVHINNYMHKLANENFSQKSTLLYKSVINMIFNYAIINGFAENNPCQYVPLPKNLSKKRREIPSDSDVEKVKNGLNCYFGLFAYMILYTGMRRSEALALQYEDIDFEKNIIHVNKSLAYEPEHGVILKKPKTEAGIRNIILLSNLKDVLPKDKTGFIFTNQKQEPIHPTHFDREWNKYKQESGVQITPHQLRHPYVKL